MRIGFIFSYLSPLSGKIRPAMVVEPYEGTEDFALVAVLEPLATPFGIMFVETFVPQVAEKAIESDPLPDVPFGEPQVELTNPETND